jgi:hypothetical protein
MIKNIKITGNAETVGYAIDAIKDKKIRYEIAGESDSFKFDDYEVQSIDLKPVKKDPYQLVGIVKVKATTLDFVMLTNMISRSYSTLLVSVK